MAKKVSQCQAWWVDGFEVRQGMCKNDAVKGEKIGFKWMSERWTGWDSSNLKETKQYGDWLVDIFPTREGAIHEAMRRVKQQMEMERLGLENCERQLGHLETMLTNEVNP